MGVGNGCGSIFIEKQNSSTKNPKMEETVPMDETYTNVLIYSNGKVRKLSISEALLGKKNHEALIGLVESYNDLETKYRDLVKKYGMLEENYHNEKSLALQLKRDQIKHENELLQKTEEEESLESDESNEHGDLWNKIRESWKNQHLKNAKKSHLHAKRNRFRKIFNIGNVVNSKPPPPKVENAQNENNNYCPDEDFQNFQNRWKKVDGKQNEKVMEENSSDDISPDDVTENTDTTNNVVNMAPEPPKKKCTVKRYGKYKTVYSCDRMRMLEVADEDFPRDYAGTAETDLDENLTECALCDHQSEAITVEIIGKKIRVVSPFSENETDLTDDSDPFDFVRKNLDNIQDHQGNESFENVSDNKESHKQTEEEKELCKRERYGAYQTVYSCPNGKILESKDPGFILSPWQDGCFACTVDGIFVEVVNNSIRVISKYEGENLTQNIDKDPFDFIRKDLMKNRTAKNVKREEREEISKQKESEKNEQIAWMKNRLAKVELEFDMYKWRVGSKWLDKISELQFQISDLLEERREEHKEFKLQKKKFVSKMKIIKRKLIAEKEELENEKNRHEAMLQSEKENFSKWKLKEQKKLKYDSTKFEANVEKRNEKFKMKIKKAKELLNKNLKAKYAKISQMKSEYVRSNKKAKDTVRMFERRNRRLASQLNSLRVLYKSTESKLFHYERISDSEFTLNSHDAEITKPTSNDEALRKVVNKYKKKHKECQWRIPMTSCACDSFPGKPTPPTNLRNPSTLPLAEYSVPLKPSPSRKQNGNNKTESTDNNPNEKLSYLYNTEERRLVNSYDVDWHDKLMKSRRHVREEENMQYEGPKMNWFMRYMHERENQRDESDESDKQKKANTNENLYDHMKPSFTKFKKYKNKLKRKWNNLMSNIKDKWYDMYHHGNNHHFDDLDEYEANNFDDDFYHREKYYTDENDDIIMN